MNSIRPALQRVTAAASRRYASTIQGVHNLSPQSAVPPQLRVNAKQTTFKENWLSDPSTYPIIIIMGCATTFMTGMGLHALVYYKDVRISSDKKKSELRNWGSERVRPVVSVLGGGNPYYNRCYYEGLGVDHEAWLKSKKEGEKQEASMPSLYR